MPPVLLSAVPQLVEERELIGRSTDLARNDAHPFDDGDQSTISRLFPGTAGQALVDAWCGGSSLGIVLATHLPPELRDLVADAFCQRCALGDADAVRAGLAAAAAAPPPALARLLSRRHGTVRMAALHFCVAGSRAIGMRILQPAEEAAADHAAVARLLVEAGAPLEAKDVLGMTALAHATTAFFTRESLRVADYLIARGANVSPWNRALRTPLVELALAVARDPAKLPAVRLLCEAGCDATLPDSDGFQPLRLSMTASLGLDRTFSDVVSETSRRGRVGAGSTLAGQRVRLAGLVAAPELNGALADAGAFDPFTGRYACTLVEGGAVRAIKSANVLLVDARASCAACGARGELTRCSGCFKVQYCGRACQKQSWKAHKPACFKPTVLLPRPEGWRSRQTIHLGSATHAQWAGLPAETGSAFIIKVQRPVTAAAPGDDLVVYNEQRSLVFLVQRVEEPTYGALFAVISAAENSLAGLCKVYLAAAVEGEALRITLAPLEGQPW